MEGEGERPNFPPIRASFIVLAGGRSRRLGGGHKGFLRVGGREILERLLTVSARGYEDLLLVVGDEPPYRAALERYGLGDAGEVRIVCDARPGEGPLAGLEAGLAAATASHAWVVACDLPFLEPAVGRTLARALAGGGPPRSPRPRAAVPEIDGRLQPLCAVYERRAGAAAARCLDAGVRRSLDFLELLDVTTVPASVFEPVRDPRRMFLNVNDPVGLRRAEAEASAPQNLQSGPE